MQRSRCRAGAKTQSQWLYPLSDRGRKAMKRNLKDESGEIDRRRLLQTFGLIATGAFAASALPRTAAALAASAAQSAASGGKAFPVTTGNHLAFNAAIYAKSRDFYTGLFGMRAARDDGEQRPFALRPLSP